MTAKKPHALCLYCGKETKRTTTKYCSVGCRAKDWKIKQIHYGGPPRKLPERICPQCGKTFWRNYRSIYCSSKCMGEYRRDTGQLDCWIQQAKENTGPRNLSAITRLKMSQAATRRNAEREYTKGIGGIRKDIGHYVRSRWEANIARVLQSEEIEYTYETKHFQLENNGITIIYTPDFKINSWYIEVKGWWDQKSELKKQLMQQQYPNIQIYYIGEKEYKKFEEYYGNKIPNWERKRRRNEGGKV